MNLHPISSPYFHRHNLSSSLKPIRPMKMYIRATRIGRKSPLIRMKRMRRILVGIVIIMDVIVAKLCVIP